MFCHDIVLQKSSYPPNNKTQRCNRLCHHLLTLNPNQHWRKKKKPTFTAYNLWSRGRAGQAESRALKSYTLFCCHCTEDNCSRCHEEEWILPGWLWPSYLSLGYGTDAGAEVMFSLIWFMLRVSPPWVCVKTHDGKFVYVFWVLGSYFGRLSPESLPFCRFRCLEWILCYHMMPQVKMWPCNSVTS